MWFMHSQASAVINILKIECKNNSVIEVLEVLNETVRVFQEKTDNVFLPISVRSILKKQLESGAITNMDIAGFKSEVKKFYSTLAEYVEIWKIQLDKFTVFSWMLLKVQPEWKEVEISLNYINIAVNDSYLFNQISNIRTIVKKEIGSSADDWKALSASER